MKKINLLLRKCKSLSRQLARTSSYSSLRSRSTRDEDMLAGADTNNGDHEQCETVVVGSSRRQYHISSKHLSHPLMNALIQKSKQQQQQQKKKKKKKKKKTEHKGGIGDEEDDDHLSVKCEVVLFDHLLWMLENAYDEDDGSLFSSAESLEELADLYVV